MTEQRFYIDLEDSSGNRLGSGPITSASGWRYTARMDRAGEFRFAMPATDPQAALVVKKRVVRAWALTGGVWTEVGAGVIDQIVRRPQADGSALLDVSGADLLRELHGRSVRDLKLYLGGNPVSHATALAAVAGYAPAGWTFTPDANPPVADLYGRFNGESVLAAIIKIAEKSRNHFYRGAGRSVVFANTFSASGLRAIAAGPGDLVAETCAIVRLQETVESYNQITRIYPRGSGNGDVQLTLKATTRTAPAGYTLNVAQNYIEHDAAVAQYGVLEEFVEWREIGPVENTTADIIAASNQLFDEALGELGRRSLGVDNLYYDLSLAGCSTLLRPMQSIRVVYRDVVAGVDIDRDLNILEATWQVDASGVQTTALTVTTADRWPQGESGAVADALTQGRIYQALPQLSANEYVTNYTKNVDDDNDAVFRFRFSRAVSALRWAFFEFQILPFESTVKSVGGLTSGSGQLSTTGPSTNTSGNPSNNTSGAPSTNTSGAATGSTGAPSTNTSGAATGNTGSGGGGTTSGPSGGDTVSAGRHRHSITLGSVGSSAGLYPVYFDFGPGDGRNRLKILGAGGAGSAAVEDNGNHTHSGDSHTHSLQDHTHSLNNHTHSLNGHTHDLGSHTHSLNNHTHSLGNHTHDLGNHVHDLADSIKAIYGVFREGGANTYGLADLEYRVNSGAWAALSGAVALGDGWYRLDITAAVQDSDTLLPVAASNRVEIRSNPTGIAVVNWGLFDGLLSVVPLIQTMAVGDRVTLAGVPVGDYGGTDVNGTYVVVLADSTSFSVERSGPNDYWNDIPPYGPPAGAVWKPKTATIDAQLSVHTTIQPIYQ